MSQIRNRITDIAGIRVGHAEDVRAASGVTALVFDEPFVTSVDVRGGGPGTRETDLLDPQATVSAVDALVLSGGSAFGLDAASGVAAWLAENGRGFSIGNARVPIVPGAILFDLLNGGDKCWGRFPPYRELGHAAAAKAETDCAVGSVGAGFGAMTANLKGGLGSASADVVGTRARVGALVAVNAAGRVTMGEGPHFWASPFEREAEFGGLGFPVSMPADALAWPKWGDLGANTTLAVVATDARLTKAEAKRIATAAHDGLARAIYPVHTPLDGDIVFAVATGCVALGDPVGDVARIGAAAADTLARAITIGIYQAVRLPCFERPGWKERFEASLGNAP